MKVRDVAEVLETFAPLRHQEKWDNSGLCIGSPDADVHGIVLGLDCTAALVDKAIEAGADMIVTHHPLIFHGVKKIILGDPVADTIVKVVQAGIAVYALHTPADKVWQGVSYLMAERLGLQDVIVLDGDADGVGLGVIGNLPQPVADAQDMIKIVKETFDLQALRCSALVGNISRVAMCGGSGADLAEMAREKGAQLYISADIHYHYFFAHSGFMIMDIGHYEGEKYILETLFTLLKKNFPTFAIQIVQGHSWNPVKYY